MSLATRCPACGTVFRVVRDQLKVSEGWVRCGRCSEVFNGGQRLFELEAGAPTDAPRPTEPAPPAMARVGTALAPQVAVPPTRPTVPARPAEPAPSAVSPPGSVSIAGPPWAPRPASPVEAPQPTVAPPAGPVDATPESADEAAPQGPAAAAAAALNEAPSASGRVPQPVGGAAPTAAEAAMAEPLVGPGIAPAVTPVDEAVAPVAEPVAEPIAPETDATPEPQTAPGFVRRAERAARWRTPQRRAALGMVALLLLLLLVGQIGLHYRDHVAARWPATLPWLQSACAALDCRVEPPRYVDALNVDSSGLVRLPDSALYQLSLVVQNKAATLVRMPAVDLTLTDLQGQITARRVLTAAELGQNTDSVPAQGEVALKATLDLGERRVAGYTIELFYP